MSTVRGAKPCTPRYEVMALRNSGHGSGTRNEKVSILKERPLSQRRSKQGSTMATREVAGAPHADIPFFGFLPGTLELAAVHMGEGGRAGELKFDEDLVLPVAVRIDNLDRSR